MECLKFVSVRDAATALNVTPETIRQWCIRFGFGVRPTPTSHWRIPESRFTQLRDVGCTPACNPPALIDRLRADRVPLNAPSLDAAEFRVEQGVATVR